MNRQCLHRPNCQTYIKSGYHCPGDCVNRQPYRIEKVRSQEDPPRDAPILMRRYESGTNT